MHSYYNIIDGIPYTVLYIPITIFATANFYFLIPSPFSPIFDPLPSGNHQLILCIYEFVSVLLVHLSCCLVSTYKWNHMVFYFSLIYFTYRNPLGPCMLSQVARFPSFLFHSFYHIFFHSSIDGHCWWECKLVQPLQNRKWRFLKRLKIELPYDLVIPPLGIYLKKPKIPIQKSVYNSMFIEVLLTIAKIRKQPECPQNDYILCSYHMVELLCQANCKWNGFQFLASSMSRKWPFSLMFHFHFLGRISFPPSGVYLAASLSYKNQSSFWRLLISVW